MGIPRTEFATQWWFKKKVVRFLPYPPFSKKKVVKFEPPYPFSTKKVDIFEPKYISCIYITVFFLYVRELLLYLFKKKWKKLKDPTLFQEII